MNDQITTQMAEAHDAIQADETLKALAKEDERKEEHKEFVQTEADVGSETPETRVN